MTREQKNKLLEQIRKYFLANDELTLDRAKFEFILECEGVGKDLYGHYRQHGYSYGFGKVIKCR